MSNLLEKAFTGFIIGVLLFCIYDICFLNNEGLVNGIPVPYGVNLGGIFVLEDWFFSSSKHTSLVDTGPENPEGLIQNVIEDYDGNEKFFGECDLVNKLMNKGYDGDRIFEKFNKHRNTYFSNGNFDVLFSKLKNIGINQVRLPITWCLIYDNKEYTVKGQTPDNKINDIHIEEPPKIVEPVVEEPVVEEPPKVEEEKIVDHNTSYIFLILCHSSFYNILFFYIYIIVCIYIDG